MVQYSRRRAGRQEGFEGSSPEAAELPGTNTGNLSSVQPAMATHTAAKSNILTNRFILLTLIHYISNMPILLFLQDSDFSDIRLTEPPMDTYLP